MFNSLADESIILLQRKLNQLTQIFSNDNTRILEDLYRLVPNKDQKALFSLIHNELNSLLGFMYSKHNGHYNAEESRKLKTIIDVVQVLESNLKDTSYHFKLDDSYEAVLKQCKTFLSSSYGSGIPDDLQVIELIDHKPIFHLLESVSVPGLPTVVYPLLYAGEGSYAHVYKYLDEKYNLPVIVKRAKKNMTPEEYTRFRNEFNDLKKLDSPFIIKAFEYNEEKMEFTMECADETLDRHITRMNDRLPMKSRIRLVSQLFRAFEYIHNENLLHRDISYSNILIKHHEDGTTFIKVADFGLAKDPNRNLTRQGTVIKGVLNDPSLAVTGFENYERRHDIYALSFVINFILTGKKNGLHSTDDAIYEFLSLGIDADLNKRYSNVPEMEAAFQRIIPVLYQSGGIKV
ncbi:protein kinase family protein [Paenibacillus alkaliterrae]|uniref:protein kinase family protein n=1 Tax=Paenibacillus alkaliterrae TaxID=320909 RepID=UPI001F39AF57|nr:protein kinase family protein [Paenibacillus alkaliterrae]MCF2941527.1 protein kinase family protein [Paenibacillus alkaliterrae]